MPVSACEPQRDLGEREERAIERLVFRDEKAAGREPLPDDDAAEHGEGDHGQRGVDGDPATRRTRLSQRVAVPPARPDGRRQRRRRHRPGFVSGQTRERERDADRRRSETGLLGRCVRAGVASATAVAAGLRRGHHDISSATATSVRPSRSGSVIGVACR